MRSSTYWPRSPLTLRVNSRLVEADVVVRDSRGQTIDGLTRDDFQIDDNGAKREIKTFSVETSSRAVPVLPPEFRGAPGSPGDPASVKATPRFVALVLDDLSLGFSELVHVKAAARRFVREGMSRRDRMGIFTASGKQILPFTADASRIIETIDRFNSSPSTPNGGICPHLTPYDAYVIANNLDETALAVKAAECNACTGLPKKNSKGGSGSDYCQGLVQHQADAMWGQIYTLSRASLSAIQDISDFLGAMPGRRMILLASSGFLTQTLEAEQEAVIQRAIRQNVVVNALDAKGVYTQDAIESTIGSNVQSFIYQNSVGTRQKSMSNESLANLALSTGGLFFHNNNDLNLGFREVGLMPEVTYLLGFAPEDPLDGKYHKLKVQLRPKNPYSIQARPGYWALPIPEQEPLNPERPIDREFMSVDTREELPARIADVRATKDNGAPAVDVVLHIDVGRLHLENAGGIHTQKFTWIAALLDSAGSFITGQEIAIELALKKPTFNRMAKNGLNVTVTLTASPGSYRLRSVIQDNLDRKNSASTLPVEIR